MTLDNFKTSWKQYRHECSMEQISQEQIYAILQSEQAPGSRLGVVLNTFVFIFLLICCQAG